MTRRRLGIWAPRLLAFGLLAAACGNPPAPAPSSGSAPAPASGAPTASNGSSGSSSSSVFGSDYFTASASPLDLTLAMDAAHATAVHMTTAGGSVLATAADGTTFLLEVPKDALVEEVDITLTPVTTVQGWDVAPAGSLAVRMEPDGLAFTKPARLTITPTAAVATAIDASAGTPFAFHGIGKDAHMTLRDPNTSHIVIPVDHFSGQGFTWSVGESFWDAWSRHKQSEAEDRLRQRISYQVGLRGIFDKIGLFPNAVPDVQQIYETVRDEYERDVLNARLLLVSKSCADAIRAISEFNAWNRMIELLGRADLKIDPPRKLRLTARYVCAEENTRLCFQTGDLGRLVSELWGDVRQNELVDEGLPNDLGVYPKACGQYDLVIKQHSEGIVGPANGWSLKADIEITIPLRWVADDPTGLNGDLEGEGLSKVLSGGGTGGGNCTIKLTPGPGDRPYKGKITNLDFIRTGVHADTIRFRDLTLEFTEGHASVSGTIKCPRVPGYPIPQVDLPFVFNADPMFIIKGWKADGHPTIATKDNDRVIDVGVKGIESLQFRLIHKPGAMPARPDIP